MASSTANAELRRIGATPAYLDLDERFVESTESPGYQVPQSAAVLAFEFPDFMLGELRERAVDGGRGDTPNGKTTSETLVLGEREYTIVTIDSAEGGIPMRKWTAVGGPEPTVQFEFVQATMSGTVPVLNKDTIIRLLTTATYVVPTFEERLAAEGLSMNPLVPFQHHNAVRSGAGFIATMSTTPEVENSLGVAVFLERIQPPPSLDDAAKDKLGRVDWSKAELRSVVFAGQLGQRRSATYEAEGGLQIRTIQYVTVLGDQVLTLVAEGRTTEFDAGIAAIVDEIAASVSATDKLSLSGADAAKGNDK